MTYPFYIAELYEGKFNNLDSDIDYCPVDYSTLVAAKKGLKDAQKRPDKYNKWTYKIVTLLEVE